MSNIIGLLLILLFLSPAFAQQCLFKYKNETDLPSDVLDYGLFLEAIKDTEEPGKILITLIGNNVSGITGTTGDAISQLPYINATLQGSLIFFTLTDNFVNYEKLETQERIYMKINFQCTTGSSSLEIYQSIIDTNNHYPEFIGAPYTYTLPMPFPNNFRIDFLGDISARDDDLSNRNITFFIKSEDPVSQALSASWLSSDPDDSKRHHASLITKALINWGSDVQFNIFATDSGEPPNTSNTTITIIVDKNNSISRFSNAIYTADYSNLLPEEANGLVLEFREGDVSLTGGSGDISPSITDVFGNYTKYFRVNILEDNRVKISLESPPESFFNQSFIVLKLTVTRAGDEDSTVLHVSLPGAGTSTAPVCETEDNEDCTDYDPVIITLAVLLGVVTVCLIASIVLSRIREKRLKKGEGSPAVPENQPEMKEIQRVFSRVDSDPPMNGLPRRSVAFNDTVEEIKVARL